jgi:hypothetical protein
VNRTTRTACNLSTSLLPNVLRRIPILSGTVSSPPNAEDEVPWVLPTQTLGATVSKLPEPPIQLVELFRQHAALSLEDFWMRCFELGGMSTPLELDAVLHEASLPTSHEHNLMAHALNEYFVEIGVSQSVGYIDP